MKSTRVAIVQTDWAGDRPAMIAKLKTLVAEAAAKSAEIVCLQEFTLSPYFASQKDDANFERAESLHDGESARTFSMLAKENGVFVIGSLYEKGDDGRFWDTATIHDPTGELLGYTRKVHIPQGVGYYEDYYFGGSDDYPIHDVAGIQMAVPTCYDQWFPEMARICALNGAEFIFYPTAIGSEPEAPDFDSAEAWQTVMRGHAIANGVYIAAANRTGVEGVTFYGSSFICDPTGKIIAQASRDQTEVIVADLDADVLNQWRYLFPLMQQRRPAVYSRLVEPKEGAIVRDFSAE